MASDYFLNDTPCLHPTWGQWALWSTRSTWRGPMWKWYNGQSEPTTNPWLVTMTHNTVAQQAPLLHHRMQDDRAGKTVILFPDISPVSCSVYSHNYVIRFVIWYICTCAYMIILTAATRSKYPKYPQNRSKDTLKPKIQREWTHLQFFFFPPKLYFCPRLPQKHNLLI